MAGTEKIVPRFSEEKVAQLVKEIYGIQGSIKLLPSYIDQNFRVRDELGDQQFVLKISNASEERDVLDFQHQAMRHLLDKGISSELCPTACKLLSEDKLTTTIQDDEGNSFFVRMLTFLPGTFWVDAAPKDPEFLTNLGAFFGQIDHAFLDFQHPASTRSIRWDLKNSGDMGEYLEFILDLDRRAMVAQFFTLFQTHVLPHAWKLRQSVIHNDGNDYNVLVGKKEGRDETEVTGIIDFGDMVKTYTICELAIVIAYAILEKDDPIETACQVVAGYHSKLPLSETELEVLFPLICLRLSTSVAISSQQRNEDPDNEYISVTESFAWDALEKLKKIHPRWAVYSFRNACGIEPCHQTQDLKYWLQNHPQEIHSLVQENLHVTEKLVFDLRAKSDKTGTSPDTPPMDVVEESKMIFQSIHEAGAKLGVGRYMEHRSFYVGDQFQNENQDWRTIHTGIDLFMEVGEPLFAPLDGTVHSFQNNRDHLDYGPTIILKHELDHGRIQFFTLYGHLSENSLERLYVGKVIHGGEKIAEIGNYSINGGWPPHVHFQIIMDMLDLEGNFNGVCSKKEQNIWASLCPDPNWILGIPENCFANSGRSREEILQAREKNLGKSLSVSYQTPLKIVRGKGQYLYDHEGRAYLDTVNNVCHVGHCHPKVVQAGQKQMAELNTNTRYLHDNIVEYSERLTSFFPESLSVCFLVCTGSEANDLALRLARNYTKKQDTLVVDHAYHGNLSTLIELSPYKFDGPGGKGAAAHVHKVTMPDLYRGPYKSDDPQAGEKYAMEIEQQLEKLAQIDRGIAAFYCESVLGCGGQVVLPENYLRKAYEYVRKAGGLCIADEVQVGFGRVGSHFWAFETQGVTPDIVTLGKPIGNGHPMAAVITTPEIADAFCNGMEYFNTFGGNPVSCAVGLSVLDVIQEEKLQENAFCVGERMKKGLQSLQQKYSLIGDVRGMGLFLGVELVLDHETLAPAKIQAAYIIERMKEKGILASVDGPLHNVLKIKPPILFNKENADRYVETLDQILSEEALQAL